MRGIRCETPVSSLITKSDRLIGYEIASLFLSQNPNTWFELGELRRGMKRSHLLDNMNSRIIRLRFYEKMSTIWQKCESDNIFEQGFHMGMIYEQEVVTTSGTLRKMKHRFCYNI